MSEPLASPLALSPQDRAHAEAVERLAARGVSAVPSLVAELTAPSWAVRRLAVAALARLGDPAVPALWSVLLTERTSEAQIAAAVDALAASRGDVETLVLATIAQGADAAVLCDAAQVLGRRRNGRSVAALTQLVAHADDNVAVAAIEALGRLGGGAALDALVSAASSGSFFRTFPAIDALGRAPDPRAVAALASLLEQPLYALEATRALGRTGELDAAGPLAGVLARGGDPLVRVAAAALVEIDERYVRRFGVAGAVEHALRAAPPLGAGARRLAQALAGADAAERTALCTVLGWVGGEGAVADLLDLLDGDPAVARAAAQALERLGRDADAQHLVLALREPDSARRRALLPLVGRRAATAEGVRVCLDDPDASVRAMACEVLGRIGDPSAVPALFARLSDPDARVAQAVVAAIQALGSAETEALALDAAASTDARVRRAALRIIAYFGFSRGLDALLAAMTDPDERLRDAAIYGLPFLDDPRALEALLQAAAHASPRTRAAAMRALGQTSRAFEVVSRLRGGLGDSDAWVRYYACQSLGRLGDAESADAIIARLDDPAGQVRVAVVDALARLATPAALAALHRAASSDDPDVQRAALLGLGAAKPADASALLRAAVSSDDSATRLVALSALAGFDAPEVLPSLTRAATDPDEGVRNAAIGFLAARAGAATTQVLIGLLADPPLRGSVVAALATPVAGRITGILSALETADDEVAPLLVAALARMNRPNAVAALTIALAFERPAPRRAAAAALATQDTAAARAALDRAALEDPDPEVRRRASQAPWR